MNTRNVWSSTFPAALAALTLVAAGCDNSDPAPAATDQAITINFAAVVGATPFACGQTYTLGTAGSSFQPRDLRFYVHDVTLIYHDGTTAPLAMTDDGNYQRAGVALLDFEDGTGACATGSEGAVGDATTHTAITGRAPTGHVHGIRFTVGVPEAQNHLDATTAAAPLNRPAMFWSWTTGYKHMRIDGNITNLDPALPHLHNFHLGSVGCAQLVPGDNNSGAVCNVSNRPVVHLPAMEPETQTVVLDLEQLFLNSNLNNVQTGTGDAPGCMSGPADAECGPIFARLGLPFGTTAAGQQQVFRAQ
jgi:uncharacterized repeat protein (TIGR04052 family)